MTRLLESKPIDGQRVILTNLTDAGVFVTAIEVEDADGPTLRDCHVYRLGELPAAILDWQRRKKAITC